MLMVMRLIGLLLICTHVCAQQTLTKSLTAANGEFIGFYEFRPSNYNSAEKHPMIIFLHGFGEKGNGTTDLHKVHCCGLPSYIKRGHPMEFSWNGRKESFVVLTPQLSPKYGPWPSFYVNELIDYATKNLNVDKDRIFVTGLSLGGGATWAYASESRSNAERLAGIVPVVGPCMMTNGCNIANAGLPVLAVHSRDDKMASPECTTNAIRDITVCGAKAIPSLIMYPNGGHAVWLLRAYSTDHTYQDPNIYEWMLAQNKSLNPNRKPKAHAGADITLTGVTNATVDGGASSDPDGRILRYVWRRISGPGGDTIINSKSETTTIDGLYKAGTYGYELKVIDDRAEWSTDTISIVATVDVQDTNKSPFAYAGADTVIYLPVESITLDGSLSADEDGTITKYLWEPVSGPDTAYIDSPLSAVTTVRNFVKGTYRFRLTVTDDKGKRASDVIDITIQDAGTMPVAIAGNDTAVNSPAGEVLLNGSASYDNGGGSIVSYQWKKIGGGSATIENANQAITKAFLAEEGSYTFELEVTDDVNAVARDTVVVIYSKNATLAAAVLFPNPAKELSRLQLAGPERGEIKITVVDMLGRTVWRKVVVKSGEQLLVEVPTLKLQKGMFAVRVQGKEEKSLKLIKR